MNLSDSAKRYVYISLFYVITQLLYVHDKIRHNVHFICGSVNGDLRIIEGFLYVFTANNCRIRALKEVTERGFLQKNQKVIYERKQNFAFNFFNKKANVIALRKFSSRETVPLICKQKKSSQILTPSKYFTELPDEEAR